MKSTHGILTLTGVPSRFLNLAEPAVENWTANRRLGGEKGFLSPKATAGTSAAKVVELKRSETTREPKVERILNQP